MCIGGDPGHSTPTPLKVRVKIWVSVLPFWLFEIGLTATAYARLAGSGAPGASSDLASPSLMEYWGAPDEFQMYVLPKGLMSLLGR